MKGVSLFPSREADSNIQQRGFAMLCIKLRRRQMSNLPIRGISREWAKTLFSVSSVSLW
jgi:hypothetical protein